MESFQTNVEITQLLNFLDYLIFFLILGLTFYAIYYGHRLKSKEPGSNELLELLLMGRKLTIPLFTMTLVATWYGGIFGVTEIAFKSGIYNFVTQGLFWYITYLVFAFFLVSKIRNVESMTLPDLVEKVVGPNSSKLASVFNLFNVLPIAYTISLGLFISLLTGWNMSLSSFLGVLVVLSYSTSGGLRSVIFSDIIQFFVMCSAVALVLIFSITNFGGLSFLTATLPESYFTITGHHSWGETLSWGFIALSTLVDPNFYQRCFAANSTKTAKKGIIIATLIWFCFDICTTFGAMYAKAVIPETESSYAYLTYAIQLLPNGLRGFFLAGILATILSTLDSYLFLAGTTLSFDILGKKVVNNDSVNSQKISVIVTAFVAFLVSLLFDGNIKKVWKMLGSYSASCLLMPVLYSQLWPKKINDQKFIAASLTSLVITTFWILKPFDTPFHIDELYVGMLSTSLVLGLYKT